MSEHQHCKDLLERFSQYIDGELDESLCLEIEHHIADCDDCRIMLDTLKKTIVLYRTKEKEEETLPLDVRDRLVKRFDLEDYLPDRS